MDRDGIVGPAMLLGGLIHGVLSAPFSKNFAVSACSIERQARQAYMQKQSLANLVQDGVSA
jgi:hypothetical protein